MERKSMGTQDLKRAGYVCRVETITSQGYHGGDGVTCYRVRNAAGALAISRVSTHQTARAAWAEALRLRAEALRMRGEA